MDTHDACIGIGLLDYLQLDGRCQQGHSRDRRLLCCRHCFAASIGNTIASLVNLLSGKFGSLTPIYDS
jgi:hypothetical protein